jgi:hypothetical protein
VVAIKSSDDGSLLLTCSRTYLSFLLVIDTQTDAVNAITHPCGGVRAVYATQMGDLLFGGSAGHHAATHRLRRPIDAEPCFARSARTAPSPIRRSSCAAPIWTLAPPLLIPRRQERI